MLTALLEGLIRPVPAISFLIADFIHGDTFSRAALKRVWPFAGGHCHKCKKVWFNSTFA